MRLLIIVLLAIGGVASGRGDEILRHLKQKVVENPDSVLSVISDLEKSPKCSIPSYQLSLLRGIAYNEKRNFSLVEKYAREALSSDSIERNEKEKLNALKLLSTSQTFFGKYDESVATLSKAMTLARSSGNLAAELNILLTMAQTSFEMGDREKGYEYIARLIGRGEGSRDVRVLSNVSSAYGVKVVELFTDDRFEEALREGKKRLDLVNRMDELGGAPDGYTDQQRAYTYARMASCAEYAGKKKEAKAAYEAFNKTNYASTSVGRAYIIDYLRKAQEWEKVLAATAPLYPLIAHGDTINDDFLSLLSSDSQAMAGIGNFKEAYILSQRAKVIKDSLDRRENTFKAKEYASAFALDESEYHLLQTQTELRRKQLLLFLISGVTVLIIIIMFLLYRAYQTSVRERERAVRRVDEIMERSVIGQEGRPDIEEEEDNNKTVFLEMQSRILQNGIFTDPNFNRDSIVSVTGLPKSKVVYLIERFTGLTPGEYISKLRVEHSVALIHQHPDWTIDAIAEECGYVRRATYYTHFNKFFGITPAQYRRQKKG